MKRMRRSLNSWFPRVTALALAALSWGLGSPVQAQLAVNAPLIGEIELITINDRNDHWSGGTMVVGGQVITIPRNLLIDLPANRVTLQQLYAEAPAACLATSETGLAKSDVCNATGAGGFATVTANRTSAGNVIVGDLFVAKGLETVSGVITYIDFLDGYFRLNGVPGDSATGVMVRINDPDGRHTVQAGLGCLPGSLNCSPDPRFTLDADNYTNVYSTGYPLCIPSMVQRNFPGLPAATSVAELPAGPTVAAADGTGDLLCPSTNRGVLPVPDSRRFAPIQLGDQITVEGNFETINGVRFLSAHTSNVGIGLTTKPETDQPDYLFVAEFEVDAAGFQNQRARTLMIGFATLAPVDILIWSLHYDPLNNAPHEFPLASVLGCDLAAGAGECGGQGLVGQGNLIWKIRHDIDFLIGADAKVNPCAHLRADSRFGTGICPGGSSIAEQFAIVSPMPHEIQARTGHSVAFPGLVTLDVNGNEATNGQYLFPFGVGLGGIAFPEMNEINLNALFTPFSFTGLPWTLDRRLSPAGCIDTSNPPDGQVDCELDPQPLDPYPFEGSNMDPRVLASVPQVPYNDPHFTNPGLARTANRILSYVNPATGNFGGDATVLPWPPINPGLIPIAATPIALPSCGGVGINEPVVAADDAAETIMNVELTIDVLANDAGTPDPASIGIVSQTNGTALQNANGTVRFTPTPDFPGPLASFVYTVNDRLGNQSNNATVNVQVTTGVVGLGAYPIAGGDTAAALDTTPINIPVLANDTFNGVAIDPLDPTVTVNILAQPAPGTGTVAVNADKTVTFTPVVDFQGSANFTYSATNGLMTSNLATVAVTVTRVNTPPRITAIPNQTTVFGTPFTVHATATDSLGDTQTFSLTTAPAGMTIGAASGLIRWTPSVAQVGANPVTVRVTDQGGLFAAASFTVTAGNTPPQLAAIAAQTAGVDEPFTLLVAATDTPNDTLAFTLTTAPAGMTVDAATGLISWTPVATQVGAHPVTVRVTDLAGLTATASFTVTLSQDKVSVLLAQFKSGIRRWRVEGVTSAPGAVLTIYSSANLTGTPLGRATADAFGVWRFKVNRNGRLPNATRRISVRSSAGGRGLNVPVTVLP